MKSVILYKGKYGATQQYAKWLSDRLHIESYTVDAASKSIISTNDNLFIGSAVYVGKMLVAKWLKRNESILGSKKLYFFIVCATPFADREKTAQIIQKSIPASLRKNAVIHFLKGRMVMKDLSWIDSLVLKLGAAATKDPVQKAEMLRDFDEVKEENLTTLVHDFYVRNGFPGAENYSKAFA